MDLVDIQRRARALVTALAVVCAAFVLSQVFYFGIAWFLLRGPGDLEPLAPSLPEAVSWSLAVAALALLVAAPALRSVLMRQAREEARTVDEVLARHRAAAVVGYALREGAGVVGLVLSLLSGELAWCLALGALATLALLGAWPRQERVEEDARTVALRGET